jgi:hypothetical protein
LTTTEAGGTATFTVVLTSQPTANVTVGLSSSNGAEGTVGPASLTFTSGNWNVAQTVTVTGVDDFVDDGNIGYTIVTAAASSADGNYSGLNASDVSATNTDNDTAGITVSAISGNTTEAGGATTFTVVLNSQPTANVSFGLSSGDLTEGTLAPASLTFTAGNWSVAQTVTVTGVDDFLDDGNVGYTIVTAAATSPDASYTNLNAADVSVINTDNDTAGITVSAMSGNTTEVGGTATFTVVLNSQPTADVSIGLSSSDLTEGTVAPASLTFTAGNWNAAQTVTVTGADDFLDDGDIAYSIVTAAATSADANYANLNPSDVSVTNTDNDTAGIAVSTISGNTTEAGGTTTFTVVLTSQPTANVTIGISSNDSTEGTVSTGSLTFTAANWNVVQTITVTGVEDFLDDGDVAFSIVTAVAISADANYDGLNAADVSVTNTDNDTAGITVNPVSGLTTTEAGSTATFTVVLNSQPTADVTVGLSSSNTAEGTVGPASLTFTSGNWNVAQTVTVTGVNDFVDDGNVGYTILTAAASSADGNYNGLNASDVSVTNTDNDSAGVTVSPTAGLTTTEAEGTATFTVVLNSQPTADVTVGLSSSNVAEGAVGPASVTFTSGNWNVAQTVTVTGVNDFVDDGNVGYTILTAAASSADGSYTGLNASDVSVTNTDNDSAGVTVSPTTGLTTTEAGGTATFTVVLDSRPTADVTVGLSSSNTAEGTVGPASVTFTSGNWSAAQTVTVTGVADFLSDGDVAYTIVTGAAASVDANYAGLNPADVAVTNRDDVNDAPVNVVPGSQSTAEDTSLVFSVSGGNAISVDDLDAGMADLQVSLSVTNGTLALSGTTALTITAGANGSAAMTFTGPQSAINLALDGLTFAPALNYFGQAVFSITTDDLGSSGTGGPQADSDGVDITVTPINDAPSLAGATLSLAENSTNGTAVGTVSAGDVDPGDLLTFSITGGNTGATFDIDSATGQITVSVPMLLDFETTPVWSLTVRATDAGGLFATAAVTVNLTNANEAPDVLPTTFGLVENSAISTVVGTVTASDTDAGDTLIYSITAGNTGGTFSIDPATGQIAVANTSLLDFETTPVWNLTVRVADAGGLFDTATVTVNLSNTNEAPNVSLATFNLPENSTAGTVVGIVSASDVDAGDVISFAITAGNASGAFAIDPASGQISVTDASLLDFETAPVWNLTVRGTDAGGLLDTATVTVNLANVNEAPDVLSATFNLPENSTAGIVVGVVSASDVDVGDTLGYAITAGNSGGAFAIDVTTGQVTVSDSSLLNFEATPVWTLTVRVTDVTGLFDTATVTVNLTNVNETPDVLSATFSLPENPVTGTAVGMVLVTDADAGDVLSFAIIAGNAGGTFAVDPATGQVTVSDPSLLNFESTPAWMITVRVTDAGGLFDSATATINLTNVNESPDVSPATFNLVENSVAGTVVGTVSGNDVDAGDARSFSITAGNTGGAFAIDSLSGQISVADPSLLDFEATPVWMVAIRVTDTGGLSDTATITISLANVNETPDVLSATHGLAENSATGTLVATVSASDVDSADVLGFAITDGNTGGAFGIDATTGQITVSNSSLLDFEGTPAWLLTVRVTDAGGLFDTATVTINLANVNEAPDVLPTTFNLAENSTAGTVVGTVTASDTDSGDTLNYTITAGNAGGAFAIDATTGQVTVSNPSLVDFESSPVWTLTVRVADTGGLFDTTTVTVNLTHTNEAPDVLPATFILPENSATGTVVGIVSASDVDAGDTLGYTITAGNTGGTFRIDLATGRITVNDSTLLDFETNPDWTLTVRVTDAGGLSDTTTVTVNLVNVNETPDLPPVTFSSPENSATGTTVGTVSASDLDAGDTLSFAITAGNAGGTFAIDAATGQITVSNPSLLDFESTPAWMLTVRVTDTGGLSDSAAVTINLTNVNETPIVLPASLSLAENSAASSVVGTVSASDVDAADVLGFAITSGNTGGTFAIDTSTGQVTVSNPSLLDFETSPVWILIVRVTDATGLFDSAAVTINLTNVNETPDVLPATFGLVENSTAGTLVGAVTASDVDLGDVLSHAISAGNSSGAFAIDSATGQIVVADPSLIDFETTSVWTLTVSVTDAGGLPDSATITVILTDINEAPTILPVTLGLTENPATGTVVGSVSGSDVDAGDVLNYAITAGNSTGAFAIDSATGQVTVIDPSRLDFETTPGWSLTVQVSDAGGLGDSATVTINLTNVNETPVISVPGTQSTLEDTAILFGIARGNAINVADQDAGLGQIELSLTAINGRLTLSAITGLTFTTGDGADDPQLVFRGSVADVNAALDGMQFQPAANFAGLAALTVNCDDLGNSGSGSANVVSRSVLIDVAAVNDPPTSQVPGPQQTPEDTPLVLSSANGNGITVADLEVGSGVLEVTLTAINGRLTVPQPAWLVFSAGGGTNDHSATFTGTVADINAALDGLQFTPDSNFNGLAAVTITVSDLGLSGTGGPQSVTETVLIDVVAVNDAPQVTWPGPQTTDEDVPLAFSTAGGNAVRVDDLDADNNSVEVTLTVTHGTLTLADSTGLTFTNGDGTADATLTFIGTVSNVNAALDGLRYTPDHDFHGATNMTLLVGDHSQSGSGGSLTATQIGTIAVTSVLDLGEISLPTLPPGGAGGGGSGQIVVAISTDGGPGPIGAGGGGGSETTRDVPLIQGGGGDTEHELPPVTNDDEISNTPPVSQPIPIAEPRPATDVETPAPVDIGTIVMVPDIPAHRPPVIPGWITLSSVDIRTNSTGTTLETVGWVGSSLATMAFAGYVVWNLNYSWLVAGALAARPLWRQFDPLVILELWETSRKRTDDDEEAIRGLFG